MSNIRSGVRKFSLTLIITTVLIESAVVLLMLSYLPYSFWVKVSVLALNFVLLTLFLIMVFVLIGIPIKQHPIEDMNNLVPSADDLPGREWERLEEEIISGSEDEISELETSFKEFDSGVIRIFDLNGKKAAFTVLRMTFVEEAKTIFSEIFEEWGMGSSYSLSLGEEGLGIKPEAQKADATIFRIGRYVSLTVLGGKGVEKRDSIRYARISEEKIKESIG